MRYVKIIPPNRVREFAGEIIADGKPFNIPKDADGNFYIGIEESVQYRGRKLTWIRDLPIVEYKKRVP